MRDVGHVMKMGPVVAVRTGSPAERAGFKVGDVLLQQNGEAVGDPLSLGQRLIPPAGHETTYTFVVARQGADGKSSQHELTVSPEPPSQYQQPYELGGPVAIESIGLAYAVTPEVAGVEEDSSAAGEKLQPGDRVISARFAAAGPREIDQEEKLIGDDIHKEIKLDGDVDSWTRIHALMQHVLPDTALWVKVDRGGQTLEKKLHPADSTKFYDEQRGLGFYPLKVTHQAKSASEALYLGGREVKERMTEVLATISQLVTRRVSPKHLMGPVGIITVAGGFASQGLPTLLIFLTILSANLAVLNFLPIPVLDGGHMLFLAWEGITRKPVNPNVQGYLSLAGLLLLLSLMIFATAMDFNRFFS
jgi:regulator of sigma E protease